MVQQEALCIEVALGRSFNILTLNFSINRLEIELLGLLPVVKPVFEARKLLNYHVGDPISVMLTDEAQTHDSVLTLMDEVVQAVIEGLSYDRESNVDITIDDELSRFLARTAHGELEAQRKNRNTLDTQPIPLFPH